MTALKDHPPADPEVLIEEARRRQRRRRTSLAGIAATCLAVAGAFWLTSGGGPPSRARPTGQDGGGGTPSTASWKELTAPSGFITPNAEITSIVAYRGELVAVGAICADTAGSPLGRGCVATHDPVVWVSRTGADWRVAFAAKPAGDSSGNERLVATHRALILADEINRGANEAGALPRWRTALWRSTDLRAWTRVALPKALAAADMTALVSSGKHTLAVAGATVWSSSSDGADWLRAKGPPQPDLRAIGIGGFASGLLAVEVAEDGRQRLWRSSDGGVSWVPANLPVQLVVPALEGPHGVLIGSAMAACHVCDTPQAQRRWLVWSTPGTRAWHSATVSEHPHDRAGGSGWLFRVDGGLLDLGGGYFAPTGRSSGSGSLFSSGATLASGSADGVGSNSRSILWSRDGKRWSPLTTQHPPADEQLQTAASVGGSVVVAEQATRAGHGLPANAVVFWRLKLDD